MKYFCLFLITMLYVIACTPYKHCTLSKHYIEKVDTTKPYMVKGKYCLSNTKDTMINGNMGVVIFNVFDRLNGNIVKDGVTWFNGIDTINVLFNEGKASKQLPEGDYIIVVSNSNYLALKTKIIKVQKNKEIFINFYLGNILQW